MNLTNKWMNDPTFLAQSAHFFGAVAAIMTATYLFGKTGGYITAITLLVSALVKEFWYDANYEIPTQTFWDNALDFTFYFLGAVISCSILYFAK